MNITAKNYAAQAERGLHEIMESRIFDNSFKNDISTVISIMERLKNPILSVDNLLDISR